MAKAVVILRQPSCGQWRACGGADLLRVPKARRISRHQFRTDTATPMRRALLADERCDLGLKHDAGRW